MILGAITYDTDFYWKGDRYKQVIRPKGLSGRGFNVICRKKKLPFCAWVNMPSGRIVKPVMRVENN